MRVLIIAEVYLPKIDGVVIRTMNLIRELTAAGDEVMVVAPEVTAPRDSPVPCVEFPSFPFPMYPEYRIGKPDHRLAEAAREFQPDVVHFLNPFAFGFQCYDVLQRSGCQVPVVFSFHTLYAEFVKRYGVMRPLSGLFWWLTKHYHNRAAVNLTVSSVMQGELQERGFERVHLWQPAVNAEMFHPKQRNADMRKRLQGEHQMSRQLLTVSRLAPEKNVEFLASVLRQIPDASLAVVGDGPHRPSLEAHFAGLPVNFVGYLKGEELAQAYASSDAFVYASETETMGNVILEAMACETPVVAPRAGGIPSLVEHEKSGLLFTPGDTDTAVQYVHDVLAEGEQRESLIRQARQFAAASDWTAAAMRVRSDYEYAIEHSRDQKMRSTSLFARAITAILVSVFRIASRLTSSKSKASAAST